jgi:hypothetical protein
VEAMTAGAIGRIESESEQGGLLLELRAMGKAMRDEDGLLNHAQAALVLEISARRVAELVELRKLRRFDFLGRTYVSVKEVLDRREADVKAGRPKRGVVKRLVMAVKTAAASDVPQLIHGGPFGPDEKEKAKIAAKAAKAGKKK